MIDDNRRVREVGLRAKNEPFISFVFFVLEDSTHYCAQDSAHYCMGSPAKPLTIEEYCAFIDKYELFPLQKQDMMAPRRKSKIRSQPSYCATKLKMASFMEWNGFLPF